MKIYRVEVKSKDYSSLSGKGWGFKSENNIRPWTVMTDKCQDQTHQWTLEEVEILVEHNIDDNGAQIVPSETPFLKQLGYEPKSVTVTF